MYKTLSIGCLSLIPIGSKAQHIQPNIIIIVADDAGYADFGFMGSTSTKTPNIDNLAKNGTYFTDAHTAATVSSPSRAMMLTGRYGQRFGYECNTSGGKEGLPANELIIPQILKKNGYRTACIGKWHLGESDYQHPNQKGFDEFYGLTGGSRSYFYDPAKESKSKGSNRYQHNGSPIPFEGYFTDELTQKAKEFIISTDNDPFMMYLAYTAPHSPNQAKKEDFDLFDGNKRQTYAAMLYGLDRGIGEVVKTLKAQNKLDNTLIFFLSDNGGATTNGASNLPLKGFKGNKFEGGHRVPFIISWGNKLKNEKAFTGLTSSLDIFPTIMDAANVNMNSLNKPIDGVSLLPYLKHKTNEPPHNILYWRKLATRAIRKGDYKMILTQNIDTVLYNITNDPSEVNNLMHAKSIIADDLMNNLRDWEAQDCIPPIWGEDGWESITNGYHLRLMNNEIFSASDLKKNKK